MHRKALLIAPYFPPRHRVGSIRPFRFVTHLKGLGWSPAVIALKEPSQKLTQKEREVLKDIPLYELEVPFSRDDISLKPVKSKSFSLSKFIDDRFPLDTWLPLFFKEREKIIDFSRSLNPDLVWSTSDPWSSNYMGFKISEALDLPWVADFRDPWTLCSIRYSGRRWPATYFDKRFERKVMNKARKVTFTAKSTEDKYLSYYPVLQAKTKTIYNSFDRSFYQDDPDVEIPSLSKEKLNILFLGKFRSLSTAYDILCVLRQFKSENADYIKAVEIYSFADLMGNDLELAKELGVENQFKTIEIVPNENVLDLINKFDLLLLSTHPGRDDIVPAKLIDYLVSKPPILSLAPNSEVGEIIKKTDRGVHFKNDEREQVPEFLKKCISLKKSGERLPYYGDGNSSEISKFEAKQTTSQLVDVFNEIISNE